jgi:hypothetical protein
VDAVACGATAAETATTAAPPTIAAAMLWMVRRNCMGFSRPRADLVATVPGAARFETVRTRG